MQKVYREFGVPYDYPLKTKISEITNAGLNIKSEAGQWEALEPLRARQENVRKRLESIEARATRYGTIGGVAGGFAGYAAVEGLAGFLSSGRAQELGVDMSFIDAWGLKNLLYKTGNGEIAISPSELARLFADEEKAKDTFAKYPKLCDAILKIDTKIEEGLAKIVAENVDCQTTEINYEANTSHGKVKYVLAHTDSGILLVRNTSLKYSVSLINNPNNQLVWGQISPGPGFVRRISSTPKELASTFMNNSKKCESGDLEPGPLQSCQIGEDTYVNSVLVPHVITKCQQEAVDRLGKNGGVFPASKGQVQPLVR